MNTLPIKAREGQNNTVEYEFEKGSIEIKSQGTRSWRNNNPGNIRSGNVNWNGKIGEAGGFCVFNHHDQGMRAIRTLLTTYADRYNLTLKEGIARYAPSSENNTEAYISDIVSRTKIPAFTPLRDIKARFQDIAEAIKIHEGYKEGQVVKSKSDAYISDKKGAYIWRTKNDGNVRPEHSILDGQMFTWDNPPSVGHPGDDYGCRCIAEPVEKSVNKASEKIKHLFT